VQLKDKVAIVSGIGPGMGRDISLAFAREGARLALAARSKDKLEETLKEVQQLGAEAIAVPTDISKTEDCARLVAKTVESTIDSADLDKWRQPFEVNVLGTLRLTQQVIPHMKKQGGGSIVMINSMVIRDVLPTMADYAASKAALMAATHGLARELGASKIRVNSVVPGYIWGPSLQWYFNDLAKKRGVTPQQVYDEVAGEGALHHIPTSEEIAPAVVFFASDASRVITGQSLDVNGGNVFH
jgi:NAD(P)-dependent dehydrogenase (short-subunit alcohol dehydrogenase family)